MTFIEITKETERSILLSLKNREKSLTDLTEEINVTKDWMIKKLNDLNEMGALLEHRGKSNERFVRLSENVVFEEIRNYKKIINPILPSILAVISCFIIFLYGIFNQEIFDLSLIIFSGSLIGFLPSLFYILFRTWKEPSFIKIKLRTMSDTK